MSGSETIFKRVRKSIFGFIGFLCFGRGISKTFSYVEFITFVFIMRLSIVVFWSGLFHFTTLAYFFQQFWVHFLLLYDIFLNFL